MIFKKVDLFQSTIVMFLIIVLSAAKFFYSFLKKERMKKEKPLSYELW